MASLITSSATLTEGAAEKNGRPRASARTQGWVLRMQVLTTARDPLPPQEREHRPTRKAALSMELSNNVQEKKMAAEMEAASKKKASEQQSSKGDRKLYNLDSKEVYEVFR